MGTGSDLLGRIVRSTAGHDRDKVFLVVGETEDGRLLLANGKQRRLSAPKVKKRRHTQVVWNGEESPSAAARLRIPLSDRELRRALAAYQGR